MKYNEAIYRSPKWLRNFVDYEINTGKDIKGEPSLKRQKEIKLEQWDKRWKEVDKEDFVTFFYKTYQVDISSSGMFNAVKKQFRGDDNLWKMFDEFISNRDMIKREINEVIEKMERDFALAPYSDKITTPTVNGQTAFHYKFESGTKIRLEGNKLHANNAVYTLNTDSRNKFVKVANVLINKGKTRPKTSSGSSSGSGSSRKSSGSSYNKWSRPSWADHPKAETYISLKKSIELRKEQLGKMAKGPDKTALENELKTAEVMLNKMKEKYQFEHLQSYEIFTKV